MKNFTKTTVGDESRTELHEALGLTGAEVSINRLPAGAGVPFVHSHKQNEELYGVLSGKGKVVIDGEEIALAAGDWIKIAPAAKRQFSAAPDEGITFVCIQTKENSLGGFPADDAVVYERKWHGAASEKLRHAVCLPEIRKKTDGGIYFLIGQFQNHHLR